MSLPPLDDCYASDGALVNACSYSFESLYLARCTASASPQDAAPPTAEELQSTLTELYGLDRERINERVLEWAAVAGWCTERQTGSDGASYVAFAPPACAPRATT